MPAVPVAPPDSRSILGAPSGTTRRGLFAEYARAHGTAGIALAAAWSLVAVGLMGLLVTFDIVHIAHGEASAEVIVLSAFIVALLWLLSIVEGSELAVARLLGVHPSRIRDPQARATLEKVQADPKSFFNGRQALVVTSIVALTLAVTQIAKLHQPPHASGHDLISFLRTWPVQAALLFGFPNFIVLWWSQLYPKLRAASNAPVRFSLVSYQFVIKMCIRIESTTHLGAPTSVLGILRDRVLLTGVAKDAAAMETIPDEDRPGGIQSAPTIHQTRTLMFPRNAEEHLS